MFYFRSSKNMLRSISFSFKIMDQISNTQTKQSYRFGQVIRVLQYWIQRGFRGLARPPPPPAVYERDQIISFLWDILFFKKEIKLAKRPPPSFTHLNPLSRNPGSAPEYKSKPKPTKEAGAHIEYLRSGVTSNILIRVCIIRLDIHEHWDLRYA